MFPGAQPVSFQQDNIYMIQQNKFLVCEKTDGLRYFLIETNRNEFFITDRQYNVRKVTPRYCDFKQLEGQKLPPVVNIFDGELVLDNHQPDIPIFLVFDAILVHGNSVMLDNFEKRLIAAHNEIRHRIREDQIIKESQNKARNHSSNQTLPKNIVDIFMKDMFRAKDVGEIFDKIIPKLQHENDGLIFT